MDREDLIGYLLEQIEYADAASADYVRIRKGAAEELVRILSGRTEPREIPQDTEGKILFYCADCGKSFRAAAREDRERYAKWQYHTWYAVCPNCGREVCQNDRYWR